MSTIDQIPQDCLHFKFINASGPGGQHVNKASTAVELTVDLKGLPFTVGQLKRLKDKHARKINKSGRLIIQVESFRSQLQNRKEALNRLSKMIDEAKIPPKKRIATKPTKSSKRKRLDKKKRKSLTKVQRQTPKYD
ncbi:alternative ribosome rescue aminoacyl-tRNA hydrolase ArfB [Gammaproteobacteria bacterium]|nr:alternative ribosome rescue aminoacyl-tRNA hydrolase ArfB [Gammaproteobacteria bacterium]